MSARRIRPRLILRSLHVTHAKNDRPQIERSREPFLASNIHLNGAWIPCSPWDQERVITSTTLIHARASLGTP